MTCAIQRDHNWSVSQLNIFAQISYFLSGRYDLAHRLTASSPVPYREPLLATPGVCEATHILPAAQDGDLALSHFHWKTTASGYHRCQQGARGVALAMMLLAAAAAGVGKTCFPFIFCLALWLAGYETLLYHLAEHLHCRPKPNTVCYVYTFRLGSNHYPDDCSRNWGWDVPWVLNWRIKWFNFWWKEGRVSVKMTRPMITISSFECVKA